MRGGARSAGVTLETRRRFLKNSALATAGLARARCLRCEPRGPARGGAGVHGHPGQPWYRRTRRWMQTNIAEKGWAAFQADSILDHEVAVIAS